jgi:hypothetical protein
MSIVGISGSSLNLYQYLQSLTNATNARTTATQAVGTTDANDPGTTRLTTDAPISQGTSSTNSGPASLVQQLETSIQNAVNGVNVSQSNNPQAVLSAIEQAIQTTLQENSFNPSQLSQTALRYHGFPGGSARNLLATPGTNGGSSSMSRGISASSNPLTIIQTPGLEWLLSQLNIDSHQFRNDVISALPGSQNRNLDQSQVFQSFPTGQNVNVFP